MAIGPFHVFVAKAKARASEINEAFAIITDKFSSAITSADLSPSAGIKGTRISSASGYCIQTANLQSGCVTSAKLQSSASSSALRAVTANHIQDAAVGANAIATDAIETRHLLAGAITNAKVAPGALLFGALKLITLTRALSLTLAGNGRYSFDMEGTGWTGTPLLNGQYLPILVGLEATTDPPAVNFTTQEFFHNTSTGKWFACISNVITGTLTIANRTLYVVILAKA